jgi:hypothetical protein
VRALWTSVRARHFVSFVNLLCYSVCETARVSVLQYILILILTYLVPW